MSHRVNIEENHIFTHGKYYRLLLLFFLIIPVFMLTGNDAEATPIDSNLLIYGEVSFDDSLSAMPVGGALQTGNFKNVAGGVSVSASFINTTVTGPNPNGATLTEYGDGVGMSFEAAGYAPWDENPGFYGDYFFSIQNSSSDAYIVTLEIDIANFVDAFGDDSFAHSLMSLENDSAGTEIFFTDLSSDTFYGNEVNGVPEGGWGGPLSDTGPTLLDVMINPLSTLTLSGYHDVSGGVFDPWGGNYNVSLDTFISIYDAQSQAAPEPVPEPTAMAIFGMGLAGLAATQRRKKNIKVS